MMNIVDYLVGNTDRHWGNWGFWVDNANNQLEKLHPLMDFNRSFRSYDSLEGARCLTAMGAVSQKDAALEAVKAIGLCQIHALPDDLSKLFSKINELFGARLDHMFGQRLELLQRTV